MKFIATLTLFLFSLSFSIAQTINNEVIDDKGKAKLLGEINKEGLQKEAYKKWFNTNHDDYIVNKKLVKTFKDSLSNYTIKVFLGTWCGDSKKEVPRLYNVLETAKFNMDNLEVFALDKTKEDYKQGPNGEEKGYNIHRVPTIIFFKDGKEVNRIVEHPQETLENDILKIVNGQRYYPKYHIANIMFNNLEKYPMEDIVKSETYYLTSYPNYSEGSKELNTLGYVYKNDKQLEKALFLFNLNTKMFPYDSNVYDSLGEAQFETKDYTEALKNYNKVLELKPKDKNALEMVEKIKLEVEN